MVQARSQTGFRDRLRKQSETGVNPSRNIVKKVLYRIGILPRKLLALCAWRNPVSRSFDNNQILIGGG